MALSRWNGTLALLIAAAAASFRCHDTVTGPNEQISPTPTPGPAVDLSGTWTGTMRERGLTDDYFCPGRERNVTVAIRDIEGEITFEMPTGAGCSKAGTALFTGVLSGKALRGSLSRPPADGEFCELRGILAGSVETRSMALDGAMRGSCNAIGLHVVLSR